MTETVKKATEEKSDTAQAPAPPTVEEEDLFEDFPLEEGDLPALVISCVLRLKEELARNSQASAVQEK